MGLVAHVGLHRERIRVQKCPEEKHDLPSFYHIEDLSSDAVKLESLSGQLKCHFHQVAAAVSQQIITWQLPLLDFVFNSSSCRILLHRVDIRAEKFL